MKIINVAKYNSTVVVEFEDETVVEMSGYDSWHVASEYQDLDNEYQKLALEAAGELK